MKKLIFGSVSLACVVITLASSALAGGGCGGGSYSLAGLSPKVRAEMMAINAWELAEIDRHIAFWDKSIAAAKTLDLVLSQTAGLAAGSYGVATYHAFKVIGYVAMGEGQEAGKSAIQGVFGIMGKAPGVYGAVSKATSFAISAKNAVSIGQEVGETFGQ